MSRILLIETASPKRVASKVKQLLDKGMSPKPEISILCRAGSRDQFPAQPGLSVHVLSERDRTGQLKALNQKKFDALYAFWTGEKQYRRIKLFALRLKAAERWIIAGDGNEFPLTWKAICRHALFRSRHPLPTDHWAFVRPQPTPAPKPALKQAAKSVIEPPAKPAAPKPQKVSPPAPVTRAIPEHQGERILILQSAEPPYVLQALDRLEQNPLFRDPRYTLFCRNKPEIANKLQNHRLLYAVRLHSETRGSWQHLRELRKSRYDALVLFLTGDPGYWKLKVFASLLGVPRRRILIFNENSDCFFFNWNQWSALILHRMRSQPIAAADSKWSHSLHILVSLLLKSGMTPFRFFWLLLVWLRLRSAGVIYSRRKNDDSSGLPAFPGT